MLAVFIMYGEFQGQAGYLLRVDGRTSEIALRNRVVRVDNKFLQPLDIAHSFNEIDNMVSKITVTTEK